MTSTLAPFEEERFRALYERTHVAMAFIALDGTVIGVNSAACELLGRTERELVGCAVADLVHPDDQESSSSNMHALIEGSIDALRIERQYVRGDGAVVWGDTSTQTVRGPDGQPRYWQAVIVDITERVLEQTRFAALLEAAPDAIVGVDQSDRIALVTARAEQLFGYHRDQLVGEQIELLFPEHVAAVNSGQRPRFSNGLAVGETIVAAISGQRSDGTTFPAEVSLSIVDSADEHMFLLGIRDGTERQQAAIVQSSSDAIIGRNLDGTITSWNAGAEAIYGYTTAQALGTDMSGLVPLDRRDELEEVMARVARGQPVDPFETQGIRKDGSILDVAVTVSPIRDAAGMIIGSSAVARDITGNKRAAEALQVERQALADRSQQSQRLESLGEMAGGVAHDFNNLLAVILNYASFIAEQTVGNDAVQADVAQIQAAAQRAANLTSQLLIFGRRETVRPAVLDLNEIVADVHELLSQSIGEQVELMWQSSTEALAMKADRSQIEQVVLNLAVNARDAMTNGGTLTIETRRTDLDHEYCRLHPEVSPGSFVELSVSDTGAGMAPGVAARIFEPFFTTKPKGENSGLGLAIVYGIVIEAGGSISVYSEEGTGSTFRLFFPASSTTVAAGQSAPAKAKGDGQTILVVEDEPAMMEVAARLLTRNGYEVIKAPTGAEALEVAARRHVDLLLTDSVMPRMSGRELAERFRELRPHVPVLFMSGYSQGVLGPQRIVDDDIALIQKPFNENELLEQVRRSLAQSASTSHASASSRE